ncbi:MULTISPECIES: hypothetical protein [unclassified Streptomyces]|nr:hypothetical protein [Streptomyces sp. 5-10]MBD3003549.1 hypothetical protein [Streptomyces sp. 5-10]
MRRQRLGQQPLPVLERLGGGHQGRRDLVGRRDRVQAVVYAYRQGLVI